MSLRNTLEYTFCYPLLLQSYNQPCSQARWPRLRDPSGVREECYVYGVYVWNCKHNQSYIISILATRYYKALDGWENLPHISIMSRLCSYISRYISC